MALVGCQDTAATRAGSGGQGDRAAGTVLDGDSVQSDANDAGTHPDGAGGGDSVEDGAPADASEATLEDGARPSEPGVIDGAADGDTPSSIPGVTIIQEDELGFSAVDGKVLPRQGSTSITGYTGTGFADPDPGVNTSISWSVQAASSGTYALVWRYAFGGAATNLRDARLLINDAVVLESVGFAYTNTWNDWQETLPLEVELTAGANFIRLEALGPGGLANIDYLKLLGEGIVPDTPRFSLSVQPDDPAHGTVSASPAQGSYPYGTLITLTATPSDGYFFQSWSGEASSAESNLTFPIQGNTSMTALFLPVGTRQDPSLVGYAAVQDDRGTPYIVTGGSLGPSVTASTLAELKSYLERPEPYVVMFSGLFQGAEAIHVASHKTLLGTDNTAHLQGIELTLNGSRNVILRNLAISHVIADGAGETNDAIEITGGARNIWVDHCELFSDLVSGKDYYDGLLDIKNGASFITVSWTYFHDHYKVSLISSGDEQVGDTIIRVTYHHDYFRNCGSRLPSIRFGKAHVFNNYYQNDNFGSCVNSRMNAWVRVENNYFENSQDAIGSWDSPILGAWEVANNLFDGCTGSLPTTSTGSYTPPYAYALDPPGDVPTLVATQAGIGTP
jgi:pectate lyase